MTTVLQARANDRLTPVLLMDIVLLNSGGTIYLSDKTIKVGATQYQNYIMNAVDISDAIKRATSKSDNPAVLVSFNNKAFRSYTHLSLIEAVYPLAGAKVTIKELYLDDAGEQSDVDTLFVGEFEEIRSETVLSFNVTAMSIKTANSLKTTGRI